MNKVFLIFLFLSIQFICSKQKIEINLDFFLKQKNKYAYESEVNIKIDNFFIDSILIKDFSSGKSKKYAQQNSFPLPTEQLGEQTWELHYWIKDQKKILFLHFEIFSNIQATERKWTLLGIYPHRPQTYTQGLLFVGDTLYESGGLYGQSHLALYSVKHLSEPLVFQTLESHFFGEGLTFFNNKLYQLTWKNQQGFIYDAQKLTPLGDFHYLGEGWGLTHDEKEYFILSNGSYFLQFFDRNFVFKKKIPVYQGEKKIDGLNELCFVAGFIFANRYGYDTVYQIEASTGRIFHILDFKSLRFSLENPQKAEVLNGIAYHKTRKTLYITGKFWSNLFEIRLN